MAEQKNIKKKKEALDIQQKEREREEILMLVDENRQEELSFSNIDGTLEIKSVLADMLMEDIDDPELKYDYYYKTIRRVLQKHLPEGSKNKQIREWIYEEKNTFLTGKRKDKAGIRHADSRKSYSNVMAELVTIITHWLANKGTAFELYVYLRDENVKRGYGYPPQEL